MVQKWETRNFCPKCRMLKVEYDVLGKLKKLFGRSKGTKKDDTDKTKIK